MKNTPDLPDELWLHILSYFSVADQLADFDPPVASYITIEDEDRVITESKGTKHALMLVSRRFNDLMRQFAFEIVWIRSVKSMQSLASLLRSNDGNGLASLFSRTTKRLDIDISAMTMRPTPADQANPFMIPMDGLPQEILRDVLTLLCSCHILTSLVCGLPSSLMELDLRPFVKALTRFTSLRVLRLHCSAPLDLSLLPPKLTELRVLDVSVDCRYATKESFPAGFLKIHTISGPIHLLCPALAKSELPSLKRIISQQLFPKDVPAFTQFLRKHGRHIRSIEFRCIIHQGQDLLMHCPNLTNLVIHYEYAELLGLELLELESIGIMGYNCFNTTSTTQMLLFVFGILEDRLEKGQLQRLRKLRILDSDFIAYLQKCKKNVLKLYDRRFRSRMVDLEDARGNRLITL